MRPTPVRTAAGVLVSVVALTVAIVGTAEFVGRISVERVAESELRAGRARSAEVTIGASWSDLSLVPAVVTGEVDRVEVNLRGTKIASVPVEELDYVLEGLGVHFDAAGRRLVVVSAASTSLRVAVDPAAVGSRLGVVAAIEDGELLLGEERTPVSLSVSDGDLVIEGDVEDLDRDRFPLGDRRYLPCEPDVEVVDRMVELSCTGRRLPAILTDALGPRSGDLPPAPTELEPPETTEFPPGRSEGDEDSGGDGGD